MFSLNSGLTSQDVETVNCRLRSRSADHGPEHGKQLVQAEFIGEAGCQHDEAFLASFG